MAQAALIKEKTLFTSKLDLNLKKKLMNAALGAWLCVELKLGHFGKWTRNTWKVLKCGALEGWRRSVGPIV